MEDGSHAEAAGQEVEHEVARMAAPLIFAFNNDDSDGSISNKKLKMRIGWFSAWKKDTRAPLLPSRTSKFNGRLVSYLSKRAQSPIPSTCHGCSTGLLHCAMLPFIDQLAKDSA